MRPAPLARSFFAPRSAEFVSQVVPSVMAAGQSYQVSVTMRNAGAETWAASSDYKLGSQSPQDNSTWGLGRVDVPTSVPYGSEATFSFTVVAPREPGAYRFQWRMLEEHVMWFGEFTPSVAVTVTSGGGGVVADVRWVVHDQLGTPRMVIDESGTLSGVSRHDYLPFGEEIGTGVGGRTTNQGYSQPDGVRQKFAGKERDNETGLDFMQARYYSSSQGRFTSPDPFSFQKEMLTDPQRFNLYAYVRNNPLYYVDPTGMIIDISRLSKEDREKWEKVLAVINAKDRDGNYINKKLRETYERLDSDKQRTFFIENHSFGSRNGTLGEFNITKHNGKDDFSEAVIQLDFEKVERLESPQQASLVSDFKRYEGLIGKTPELRAELFGHEGAHGIYALENKVEAVTLQILKDARDVEMKNTKMPYPPDLLQKMKDVDERLIPTERFAQQSAQAINSELQAYVKRKK